MNDDEADLEIAELVTDGLLEPLVDDDGYVSYGITDKMREEHPEFTEVMEREHLQEVEMMLEQMVDSGLVYHKGVNEDGEIVYDLTELGKSVARSSLSSD